MQAAQYVRMSTEHQQYSIVNQLAVIAEYAKFNRFEVVRTYADQGKSGLDLVHRPGLRQLLDDVIGRTADYQAVLVYDVSRWGRFQDADESAHYEFLCKQSGVQVHYCAERFLNDNSILASLFKAVKRTMAGEYVRELSAKTFAGQCRLTQLGFKMGGCATYGLQRMLVDANRIPQRELLPGEWKYLSTQRILVPGPEHETQVIRQIFSSYVNENMSPSKIAKALNEQGISKRNGSPWTKCYVDRILKDPKYAGCAVFGRTSKKMQSAQKNKPREEWIVQPDSFVPIVSPKMFELAQQKLASRFRTDEQLLEALRTYVSKVGRITFRDMRPCNELPSHQSYRGHFGGIFRAYQLAGLKPSDASIMRYPATRARFLRSCIAEEFRSAMLTSQLSFTVRGRIYFVEGWQPFFFDVARNVQPTLRGESRWEIYCRKGVENTPCALARLAPGNTAVQDWCLLEELPQKGVCHYLRESDIAGTNSVRAQASDLLALLTYRLRLSASPEHLPSKSQS